MNSLRTVVKRNALALFFLLTYVISFSLFMTWDWANDDSIPWFTFGPMLSAIILTALAGGWPAVQTLLAKLLQWRVGWRWYGIAFGLPVAIGLAAVGLTTLAGVTSPTAAQWTRWPSLFLIFPIRVFFSGPFGEELGWRGFALPRLQAKYAPLTATLILGLMGAIWHVPLILIGQNQWPDLLLILAGYLLMSWIYNSTNGSVLLALLFHGVTNTIGGAFFNRMYSGVDAVQFSIWHTVAWFAAALIVIAVTKANLGCKPVTAVKVTSIAQRLVAQ